MTNKPNVFKNEKQQEALTKGIGIIFLLLGLPAALFLLFVFIIIIAAIGGLL